MEENVKVRFADEHHIWVKGQQYISLNRFIEAKNDVLAEMKLLNEELAKVKAENDALKVLVKF